MAAFAELLNPVHSPEKKKILEAIKTRGPRLVPVEVATETGMALPAVMSELNTIASETNAHLEVTEAGNIAYLFQPNIEQAYTANASRQLWLSIKRVIANVSIIVLRAFCALMFFLIRISFGIALIVGFVFIVVVVIVGVIALLRGLGDGDGGGGGDGGGFDFDFGSLFDFSWGGGYYSRPFYMYWLWDWLWDWFFFWRYVTPQDTYYSRPVGTYDAGYGQIGGQQEEKRDFLSNVFTYLFGLGDPNKNFEEVEWQAIAQVIEANQGVVTAEMLAPYAGEDPREEDWMVHVLQRFNGIPEVTESGGIVYTFPAFQTRLDPGSDFRPGNTSMGSIAAARQSAPQPADDFSNLYRGHLSRQQANKVGESKRLYLDRALSEKNWEFMPISGGSLAWIIFFALTLVFGSIFVLTQPLILGSALGHLLLPFVYAVFGYGCLFFFIPAVRFVFYRVINDKIDARNKARLEYAARVANPEPELAIKLENARQMRVSGQSTGVDRTIYTTEKDQLDQEDLDRDEDYRLPPGH
ncbi:MAG: hypothetical protein JSS86_11180 [Cyanobacteria bacterium SZAS LIN-2]|nr:hypothetical protein [Cyanobacteria bacterium SZAS LIN-2]